MSVNKQFVKDFVFTLFVLAFTYFLSFYMQFEFSAETLVPTLFVMGVFFVSLQTEGYVWGVAASLISVMMVNVAFTQPYFEIDLITPANTFAAFVMLIISTVLGAIALIQKFVGQAVAGFTTVILIQLFTGSILMISLGIIGYYIARIYEEIKDRPRYIIAETCGEVEE